MMKMMSTTHITEPPEGIIITISRAQYMERGFLHWLRNFDDAMKRHEEGCTYWLRVGSTLRQDASVLYVYLCIGNKIRFRCYYGGCKETPEGYKTFDDGRTIRGRFWIIVSGPYEIANPLIPRQGFRGFRYTHKLF